jgi:hypothetical protein
MSEHPTQAGDTREAVQRAFLAAFAVTGTISGAAKAADIDRDRHYRWLEEDASYPERFDSARETFADRIESEAFRRAVEGVSRVRFNGGRVMLNEDGTPLIEQEYSDTLMAMLLKAKRPTEYRERATHEITGRDGGPIQLEDARARLAGELDRIAERQRAAEADRPADPG